MANMSRPMESSERGTQTSSAPGPSTAGGTAQKVKDQAKDVMDKAKDQGRDLMESATEMAGQAKDKVVEMAGQAKDKVQQFASATAEKAEDFGKELSTLVRRYPIPAVLIGFGVGLLLGRVSRI